MILFWENSFHSKESDVVLNTIGVTKEKIDFVKVSLGYLV